MPHLKEILSNTTYVGTRYFNRLTKEDALNDGTRKTRGKYTYRDSSEWIAVKVPVIVSKRLFQRAQERLQKSSEQYRQPSVPQLLKGFIKCGECGYSYCSVRAYWKMKRPSGKEEVRHWISYQCTTRYGRPQHDPTKWRRCYNPRIATHFVEELVLKLIREVMLDPVKLATCTKREEEMPDVTAARDLVRIAEQIRKLEETRRKLVDGYAMGRTTNSQYVRRNREIDNELKRLNREKLEILGVSHGQNNSWERTIQQFCTNAQMQFAECTDIEAKRAFLQNYIQKIIFTYGRVAILGSIPIKNGLGLPFRIEGEITDKRSRIYARLPPQSYGLNERNADRKRIVS